MDSIGEPASTYLGMMETASTQLADLLDDLGVAARIEGGRYEPPLQDSDTLELAERAAALVGEQAHAAGPGGAVRVDPDAAVRALRGFARCALRHGGLESVALGAEGTAVTISPVVAGAVPVLMVEELRDLGAAVGHRIVAAHGGTATLDDGALVVRFP